MISPTTQLKTLLAISLSVFLCQPSAFAESLFRASASYNADAPLNPRSLFTQPRPQNVGDLVTVVVDETNTQQTNLQFRVTKTHEVEENGSTFFNNFVRFYLGKVPFVRGNRIADVVPSFNGMSNNNNLTTQVQSNKQVRYTDSITCQVMQVLPNGHLIIQGKKAVQMNKELSDLYVTGIVNPYYIDRNNSIKSRQVGNLQFLMAGKGVISRQQNDGVVSKLNQFFN